MIDTAKTVKKNPDIKKSVVNNNQVNKNIFNQQVIDSEILPGLSTITKNKNLKDFQ